MQAKSINKPEPINKTVFNKLDLNKAAFTADYVISAYEKGVKAGCGVDVDLKVMSETLSNALDIFFKFYKNILSENGCESIFVKLIRYNAYFVVAINEAVYFDDEKSDKLYDESCAITRQNPSISFSFMPVRGKEDINEVALNNDFYVKIA